MIVGIIYKKNLYCFKKASFLLKLAMTTMLMSGYSHDNIDVKLNKEKNTLKLVTTKLFDHSILTKDARLLTFPLSKESKDLIKNMLDYVKQKNHKNGAFTVGLAAPQVGYPYKLFLYQIPKELATKYDIDTVELSVLINVEYKPAKGSKKELMWEGCLSIEDKIGQAFRHSKIEYTGYTIDGTKITKQASGLLGQIIQHETDHTNGILYTSRMPDKGKLYTIEELMALRKSQKAK